MVERKPDPDEPTKIPLDPVEVLRALLQVDPDWEPAPALDVYAAGGPNDEREWRIGCRICGWVIEGTGQRPTEADDAARAHRCQPEADATSEG